MSKSSEPVESLEDILRDALGQVMYNRKDDDVHGRVVSHAIPRLQSLIEREKQKARIEAVADFIDRVDKRLPDPHRNNVKEWQGHNLGLCQARQVMALEFDRLKELREEINE